MKAKLKKIEKVPLSNSKDYAIVDYKDFIRLPKRTWFMQFGYARATINYKQISMHRLIMGAKKGEEVDHINHNKLDNRRCNLRFVTRSENMYNQKNPERGIIYYKKENRWRARIHVNGKQKWLGSFKRREDAIKAAQEGRKRYAPTATT